MQECLDNYINVFKKTFVIRGRASRKEFWLFLLLNFLISLLLQILAGVLHSELLMGLMVIYTIILIIPNFTLSIRRLHDIDKSGWWLLICLIPFIGGLVLLVFYCLKGSEGPNRFGENPYGSPTKTEEIEAF